MMKKVLMKEDASFVPPSYGNFHFPETAADVGNQRGVPQLQNRQTLLSARPQTPPPHIPIQTPSSPDPLAPPVVYNPSQGWRSAQMDPNIHPRHPDWLDERCSRMDIRDLNRFRQGREKQMLDVSGRRNKFNEWEAYDPGDLPFLGGEMERKSESDQPSGRRFTELDRTADNVTLAMPQERYDLVRNCYKQQDPFFNRETDTGNYFQFPFVKDDSSMSRQGRQPGAMSNPRAYQASSMNRDWYDAGPSMQESNVNRFNAMSGRQQTPQRRHSFDIHLDNMENWDYANRVFKDRNAY